MNGDGFGDPSSELAFCTLTEGYVEIVTTNDSLENGQDFSISSPEICDGLDNDCNGDADGDRKHH